MLVIDVPDYPSPSFAKLAILLTFAKHSISQLSITCNLLSRDQK